MVVIDKCRARLEARFRSRVGILLTLFSSTVVILPACGSRVSEPSSPVVAPGSEAAEEARKADEAFKKLRQQEEAKFHKRHKKMPAPEPE